MGIVEREREAPRPGPGDIVVRVRAASLNKRDLFILRGTYPLRTREGIVPLSDGAGEVVAVGDRVTRFRVGDRVAGSYFARWRSGPLSLDLFDQLGCTLDGMLAERVVLDEQWAVRVPDHLTWEEAATLPCAAVTAWNSVAGSQPVLAGQTVLTLGTGGVSLFALQLAKTQGARVIVTTSSAAKVERLKALGADAVVNYAEEPEWSRRVREATGGVGADRVVETMGPDTIEQSMRSAAFQAQVVLLISRGQEKPDLHISADAYRVTMATIRRVFVGSRDDFEAMNRAVAVSRLRPVIDCTYPFARAREALDRFARGTSFGKVVITFS